MNKVLLFLIWVAMMLTACNLNEASPVNDTGSNEQTAPTKMV